MTYDSNRGRTVLFGGNDGSDDGETWEYNGDAQTWTQVALVSPEAPTPRDLQAMAYDAARGRLVLFGGYDGSYDGETWEYDGDAETWTQAALASPQAPSPRTGHAMAYDAARGRLVLFGGTDGARSDETWEYDGDTQTWTQVALASPQVPSPRVGHAMAYDATAGKIVLVGGWDGTFDSEGETWEYDGTSETWTLVTQASPQAPSSRTDHAMAYDASRGKVVLFGGWDLALGALDGATWEYDGALQTWLRVAQASPQAPSPSYGHAMAYDAILGTLILFGGYDGADNGESWTYAGDAQIWTRIAQASPETPTPRSAHTMAYDAAREKVVLFGGWDGAFSAETWSFQYAAAQIAESCGTGFDGDGDGLIGCADPDCWGHCTPLCPPGTTTNWPADCDTTVNACGDGACNTYLESPRLCPADCLPPPLICGDFHCDAGENQASCPGDCTP